MKYNLRQKTGIRLLFILGLLISIIIGGLLISSKGLTTNFEIRNLPPSIGHLFGTDWLGRDMFTRTLKGLTLSIGIGLLSAFISAIIALILGILSAMDNKLINNFIILLVDLFLSVPHLVTLILISFVVGGRAKGVIIGIAFTHWPSLTRLIRAEVLQLKSSDFVQISRRLGKSQWWIFLQHILPHLIPQIFIGFMLLFPHAVLHEAAITFLGFGLSPHKPAIGVILSESMKYLSTGMWWLAFFPGLSLLVVVRGFDALGDNLRILIDPHSAHN